MEWHILVLASSPNPSLEQELYSVAATSTSNVWAVGYSANGSTSQLLFLHYNGKVWKVANVTAPNTDSALYSISRVPGTKTLWAVGNTTIGSANVQALTEYYC